MYVLWQLMTRRKLIKFIFFPNPYNMNHVIWHFVVLRDKSSFPHSFNMSLFRLLSDRSISDITTQQLPVKLMTSVCLNVLRNVYLRHSQVKTYTNYFLFNDAISCVGNRDSAVGIAGGYGLDDRGVRVRVPEGSRIFCSPRRPDRLWGPPSLLYNGYRGSFLEDKTAGAWSSPITSN
jgi:hypothetical protein